MALDLYSKGTTDTLLAAKLDLAGGTMTGGLTLSASGIIFSDATYLTTAPAGSTLAADQLTAGVVTANPTSGPTASGDVLQYDGTGLVWAPGGGGGSVAWGSITGTVTDQTDLVTYVTGLGYQTASDVSTYVTGLGYLTDAPSDGSQYARQNGAWAVVTGGGGGSVAWGAITGTVTDQTDLTTYISSNYYSVSNPSGYINATTARRQGIVDGIRSIINDAGIGFDGGGYYFLPLNAGALNNPVNNGEFTSTGKWFAVWDGVGATYLPAMSVTVSSGISTITFPLTSYPPSGYGLFYTEDGGSTWYESTFKL